MSRSKIDDLLSERHRRFTHAHTPLQKLLRRAANQESWTAQLRALLPAPLAGECSVTDVRGDTVVIACRNAAAATRLRFMTDDLAADLSQLADFRHVRRAKVRVSAT